MAKATALKVIMFISLAGILFSGYLSYYELFVPGGCGDAIVSCGTKGFEIVELPACVYGLVMYLIVFTVSVLGLRGNDKE